MSEMVKRVERAIAEVGAAWIDEPMHQMAYNDLARAAIEAMREPTEVMLASFGRSIVPASVAANIWQSMIDAALRDEND